MDLVIYNGPIDYDGYYCVLDACKEPRASTVAFYLTTLGGDPDAAYRIARCLKDRYERVVAHVVSFCKSAGTLVVLGADELVLSETGELGPLDVQLRKREELNEAWSGNDLQSGLTHAMVHALTAFRQTFYDLGVRAGLTAKISGEAATNLVTGLYSKIFEQIDPARLGSIERANQVGLKYATRLTERADNIKEGALEQLVLGYPSHSFVIDLAEAKALFKHVRAPTTQEAKLADSLLSLMRDPITGVG